jgi:hypothetical protein
MNKTVYAMLSIALALVLNTIISNQVLAGVSTTNLAGASFNSTCQYTKSGDLEDLNNILQYNLCGEELINMQDIDQCNRIALSQYTLCRYTSVLDNTETSVSTSPPTSTNKVESVNVGGYNVNTIDNGNSGNFFSNF